MGRFDMTELENFFRTTINRSKYNPSDWNTPSDEVFNIAMKQVKKENAKRLTLFFLILMFGGLIVSFTSVVYLKSTHLNQLEKSPNVLEDEYASLIDADVNTNKDLAIQTNLAVPSNNAKSTLNTNYPSEPPSQQLIAASDNVTSQQTAITTINPILRKEITPTNSSSLFNDELNQQETIEQTIQLEAIATLDKKLNSSLVIQATPFSKQPKLPINDSSKSSPKLLAFSLMSGINHSLLSMPSTGILTDMSLSGFSNFSTGYQINAELNYSLTNRFNIGLSTGFYSINNHSLFEQSFEFNQEEMVTINYAGIFMMPINVRTPLGSFATTSALPINNNTNFLKSTETTSKTTQTINVLQLGVVGSYSIFDTDKFQVGVNAKIAYNRIVSQHSIFDVTITGNNYDLGKIAVESDEIVGLNSNYASVSSGVFFNYSLTNRLNLNINTNYSTAVNSVLHSQNNTIPKTYLRYFENNIGLSYRF